MVGRASHLGATEQGEGNLVMRLVIELAFGLIVTLFKTRSPILWGIAFWLALLGAISGAALLPMLAYNFKLPFA